MITYPALFSVNALCYFQPSVFICYHFSHQFSLPKDLLKLNYSALLHIHSSNEQTRSTGNGHVDMALVPFYNKWINLRDTGLICSGHLMVQLNKIHNTSHHNTSCPIVDQLIPLSSTLWYKLSVLLKCQFLNHLLLNIFLVSKIHRLSKWSTHIITQEWDGDWLLKGT
jgi:hypothetical protein